MLNDSTQKEKKISLLPSFDLIIKIDEKKIEND
jgi:hypothetical protein